MIDQHHRQPEKEMIGQDLIGKYVIVRTHSAGVHAGTLDERDGKEVVLSDSRRIWYWDGAATLSELASRGTSRPDKCKFPIPVEKIFLSEAIEIIPCSAEAQSGIQEVKLWSMHK